ncbi:hypothetical protein, partial [uncultured Akkermansia sp.]|uniref:hypothetical protein n=1 Tax=uncultured Akkermansia sp. TaxID=512294 RepID=UPI002634D9F5
MARNGKLVGREESKRPAWHILFQRKGCSYLRRMKKPRGAGGGARAGGHPRGYALALLSMEEERGRR